MKVPSPAFLLLGGFVTGWIVCANHYQRESAARCRTCIELEQMLSQNASHAPEIAQLEYDISRGAAA